MLLRRRGGCSTQWLQLNAAVAQVKANDGNRNDVIYYGLLPNGVPIANVGGCESSGVSTGPNGAQVTMAHEVGHGAGLAHGPCGTVPVIPITLPMNLMIRLPTSGPLLRIWTQYQ